MKLLITGGAGNIGSVLATAALKNGFKVRVVDILWFNPQVPLIHYNNPDYEFIRGDICEPKVVDECLDGIDYVIHAAAVVGDPASKKFPDLTKKINFEASVSLIEKCRAKGIKGLIFLSTCSNYGVADGLATEESELKPLSLYAETKVNVEKYIMQNMHNLPWIIGRLSTVYGSSPRMRFDLTVNDFAMNGFRHKLLDIFLPESFRPYLHVFDLSRILLKLVQDFDRLKHNVFNIGFPGENYQKIKIAESVKRFIPDLTVKISKEGGDLRDYQVDFSKLAKAIELPRIFDVDKSVKEIIGFLRQGLISDFDNPVYYNTTPNLHS